MSVTLQLPTVLAKLADGRRTLEAQGTTWAMWSLTSQHDFPDLRRACGTRRANRIRS